MKKLTIKFITCLCVPMILVSCQTIQSNTKENEKSSLSSDDGKLDLSLSTIEQQNLEKVQAEKFLLKAREKRIVIEPDETIKRPQNSEINIAQFARQTINSIGEKIYNRIGTQDKKSNACLRFISSDDAQRFFLEMNGLLSVIPNLTTNMNLSISLDNTIASVTAIIGGASNKIISYSALSFSTRLNISSDPKSSEGFGGIAPLYMIFKLSISVGLIIFFHFFSKPLKN